jgi:hypothetical protein
VPDGEAIDRAQARRGIDDGLNRVGHTGFIRRERAGLKRKSSEIQKNGLVDREIHEPHEKKQKSGNAGAENSPSPADFQNGHVFVSLPGFNPGFQAKPSFQFFWPLSPTLVTCANPGLV